ncbi:MAG: V-type ATP synthase subunit F [Candidatus Krumholzibacteria bacterium]|jgi:V/A-type H+-transporting ATPase subunit F|nr:V-type ATP synthase subunit F [Candidatus Krumholzibacteria bacterium]
MQFYVIADEHTVTGFKLVGIDGEVVESADEAREALKKAFSSTEIGIIVLTEKIASSVREDVEEFVFGHSFPLIIEIPDRTGSMEDRISIRQMVRSAVGVKV